MSNATQTKPDLAGAGPGLQTPCIRCGLLGGRRRVRPSDQGRATPAPHGAGGGCARLSQSRFPTINKRDVMGEPKWSADAILRRVTAAASGSPTRQHRFILDKTIHMRALHCAVATAAELAKPDGALHRNSRLGASCAGGRRYRRAWPTEKRKRERPVELEAVADCRSDHQTRGRTSGARRARG
jgi:hypothetical protein